MDIKQMAMMAKGATATEPNDAAGDQSMLAKMMQMRSMMDEMIASLQGEGKQAGFESVDQGA